MSRRLTIDFEWMQMAFEDRDGDGAWFLDLETGEVIRLTDDDDESRERIEGSADRYIEIPYQGSEAGYRDMVDFIASVDDNRVRALLDTAIQGSGAYHPEKADPTLGNEQWTPVDSTTTKDTTSLDKLRKFRSESSRCTAAITWRYSFTVSCTRCTGTRRAPASTSTKRRTLRTTAGIRAVVVPADEFTKAFGKS